MSPDWDEMQSLEGRDFLADTSDPSRTWFERYISADDRVRVKNAIALATTEKGKFELEHRVIRAEGTIGWVFSRAIPVLDGAGELVEWIGAATDITERKLAEAAVPDRPM